MFIGYYISFIVHFSFLSSTAVQFIFFPKYWIDKHENMNNILSTNYFNILLLWKPKYATIKQRALNK